MSWISGDRQSLGVVAGKPVLLHLVALVGLRVGERRTLAHPHGDAPAGRWLRLHPTLGNLFELRT